MFNNIELIEEEGGILVFKAVGFKYIAIGIGILFLLFSVQLLWMGGSMMIDDIVNNQGDDRLVYSLLFGILFGSPILFWLYYKMPVVLDVNQRYIGRKILFGKIKLNKKAGRVKSFAFKKVTSSRGPNFWVYAVCENQNRDIAGEVTEDAAGKLCKKLIERISA